MPRPTDPADEHEEDTSGDMCSSDPPTDSLATALWLRPASERAKHRPAMAARPTQASRQSTISAICCWSCTPHEISASRIGTCASWPCRATCPRVPFERQGQKYIIVTRCRHKRATLSGGNAPLFGVIPIIGHIGLDRRSVAARCTYCT